MLTLKESEVAQTSLILWDPTDCSPPGSCPWNFPGKNTGMDCHLLLQGIFPTQESNPGLLHYRRMLYRLREGSFSFATGSFFFFFNILFIWLHQVLVAPPRILTTGSPGTPVCHWFCHINCRVTLRLLLRGNIVDSIDNYPRIPMSFQNC